MRGAGNDQSTAIAGESIRTPRMTILAWAGDERRASNLWRRWYHAHLLPRPNGQPLRPLLACAGTDEGEEFTAATEENQLRYMAKFKALGIDFDVWWIDAGWYPCYNQNHERRWPITGTWEPDPERFPNGLKPVADAAATHGADLLLWFEPERVRPGTKLAVEHPAWLLRTTESENGLLNLGNPECRQWLTDHVCKLIQENGIKIYRQDHNFPPLAHWRQNEAADRQGMNENLHVQGYLQFWDDLLARNPGLWIDSCASGGRRNDLETMRRSVPLHYTDYGYGDHPVKLAFHHTLYAWIPYFKEVTLSWDIHGKARFDYQVERYAYHCGIGPMLAPGIDIRRDDYDYALARQMIAIWRRAAPLLVYGDYYPHTPFHRSAHEWVVRQFDAPETGCGFVQGIRLPDAAAESFTVHLHGIQGDANYCFENPETGETSEISGEVLQHNGFTLALPARQGVLWFYRRTDGQPV
ncbi:MAG: alpha-galactosidase [Caldilineaceae bacterium]